MVLLHAWPEWTAAVVAEVVETLSGEGARFVTVEELAQVPETG